MNDAKLKLLWAQKHLYRLEIDLAIFAHSSNAYRISRHDDIENQLHVVRFELADVPVQLCLIVGDTFYNMRSALDQLVWSLARLTGIPSGTQFPILDGPEPPNPKTRKRFESQISGVPREAVDQIKALQPYKRGVAYKSHPLWRLNEMCNLDKHRRIPANGSALKLWFPNIGPEDTAKGLPLFSSGDNSNTASVPLELKHKLDFDPEVPITVNFGGDKSGISEDRNGIVEIYNFVSRDVFPRFERFFLN